MKLGKKRMIDRLQCAERNDIRKIAVVLLVWLVVAISHLRSGDGFLRIHLQIPDLSGELKSSWKIEAVSIHDSRVPLVENQWQKNTWSTKEYIGNIKQIELNNDTTSICPPITISLGASTTSPQIATSPVIVRQVDDEALHSAGGRFLIRLKGPSSFIPQVGNSLNWQGDFWFLLTTWLQAITFCVACHWLLGVVKNATCNALNAAINKLEIGGVPGLVLRGMVGYFCSCLLIGFWFNNPSALITAGDLRDPVQQSAANTIRLAFLVALRMAFDLPVNKGKAYRWLAGATVFLLVTKCIWVTQVTSVQCSDYALYWNYGKALAAGDWNLLPGSQDMLGACLVTRAWMWCQVVAKIAGPSAVALKYSNLALQLTSCAVFFWLVSRRLGVTAGLISLFCLMSHPDLWMAVSIASHDVPAFFWIICLTWTVDRLIAMVPECDSYSAIWWIKCVSFSALAGIMIAALELQRNMGSFALAALAVLAGGFLLRLRDRVRVPELLLIISCASACLYCSKVADGLFLSGLQPELEKYPEVSTSAFLTSVESRRDARFDLMQPYRFLYFPAIDQDLRESFSVRKMSLEKVVRFREFFWLVIRNIRTISGSGALVGFALGGEPSEFSPVVDLIPWREFWFSTAKFFEQVLIILFLMRVCVFRIPFSVFEIFPLLFGMALYFGVILLGEVNASYDTFVVVPLAINIGVVCEHCRRTTAERHAAPTADLSRWMFSAGKSFAVTGILVAMPMFGLFGVSEYLRTQGISCFMAPISVSCECLSGGELSALPGFSSDDDGVYSEILPPPNVDQSAERHATIKWTIPCKVGKPLHFFLAGNQRKLRIMNADFCEGCLVGEFSLFADGKLISSGELDELRHPRFVSVIPANSGVEFRAILRGLGPVPVEKRLGQASKPIGFSAEYFWQ
jgi:hypothetical protein